MIIGSLSKPRRRRQRERHQTKGLMSSFNLQWLCTCVIILCTFPWRPQHNNNVKWPSSESSTERGRRRLIFLYFYLELNALFAYLTKLVYWAIGVPSRSKQSRILLVKYKFIFYKASSSAASSSLLKLPNTTTTPPRTTPSKKWIYILQAKFAIV